MVWRPKPELYFTVHFMYHHQTENYQCKSHTPQSSWMRAHTHTERMQQTSILRSAGVPWGYGDIEAYIMCASTFSVAMPYPPRPLRRSSIRAQLHFWIRHTEQGSPCRAPLLSFAPSLGASRMPQWSLKLILRTLRITPDGMKIYHTRARYIHISTTIWCDMKYSIATAKPDRHRPFFTHIQWMQTFINNVFSHLFVMFTMKHFFYQLKRVKFAFYY